MTIILITSKDNNHTDRKQSIRFIKLKSKYR